MTERRTPQEVRMLFVDDDSKNFTSVKSRLERRFRALDCALIIDYVTEPDEAESRLADRNIAYQVVIADVLFPDGPGSETLDTRGLDTIQQAREANAKSVIVALTQDRRQELLRRAIDAGADIARRRDELVDGGLYQLVEDIHELLCERELVEIQPTLDYDDEPGVQAAVYDIGPVEIRLLVNDVTPGYVSRPAHVNLAYVAPGASGAHVLRAAISLTDGSDRTLLLKISRNREALEKEAARSDAVRGLYRPNLVVPYLPLPRQARPRNGWSAIAMEFADDAPTLRRWLSDPSSTPYVASVLSQLFLNRGLAYTQAYPSRVPERPIERLRLPPFRRVLVRAATDALAPALYHSEAAAVENPDEILRVIEAFSREGRIVDIAAADTPKGLDLVEAHGDLHGGNILVVDKDSPRPLILDFASHGLHHWAEDVARLSIDIFLRSLDHDVDSFFWHCFDNWREIVRNIGDFEEPDDHKPKNSSAIAALRWIVRSRNALLPPLRDDNRWWEWHVSLAQLLLRGSYQVDLPPAKRVVCLVAAYDQLVRASERLPARPTTY